MKLITTLVGVNRWRLAYSELTRRLSGSVHIFLRPLGTLEMPGWLPCI